MLYQELPNLGYDEDGYPLFPSDVDERNSASQWRYCDDTDFLERIP
ncbi:MAG: hypothetical protein JXX28_05995 [Deltaproteobacteria bacterium]|nr:hypothetical protein [Deltaproteobacteria bacterium]